MSSDTDTESSCEWTIISNEGSDIETLGSEGVEQVTENCEQPITTLSDDDSDLKEDSLEVTLLETTMEETLETAEAEVSPAGKELQSVLSSSDHSDILTLGDLKEEESIPAVAEEEFYLGTSCSSQYTFTSAETVVAGQQSGVPHSSSSDDETDPCPEAAVRRRRVRRNTSTITTELEQDEVTEPAPSEKAEESLEPGPRGREAKARRNSNALHTCILMTLIIAVSMGIVHFYGSSQIQERQIYVDKLRLDELDGWRNLVYRVRQQRDDLSLNDLDVQKAISVLSEVIDKITKENEELTFKHEQIEAQRDALELLLKTKTEERSQIESQHQRLLTENYQLKHSVEKEEKSLSLLQEELKTLHSKIKDLEAVRAGADVLLSENQRLQAALEEEKEVIRSFRGKREGLMVEAQTLREKLDMEKEVTEELRREINELRQQISGAEKADELQFHLTEMEKKLSFEQQRSDLWERLYLETKEERAKGDSEPKLRKSKTKQGMAGKVKETFDAVKNSTKEFVHHHKEQIKKAKQAVKENLRKFSDTVKSTFRNFKDSASTIFNKARGFYKSSKNTQETGRHRSGRPTQNRPFKCDTFQSNHCTRKSADDVYEKPPQNDHKFKPKSCSGVFDCAYQESMSLFNKATEPIRADEFYQLLQSYLQQEMDHFSHWKELEIFINDFFHNGVFIHDQMLFTDFVNDVEDYLTDMYKYHGLNEDFFDDLDDYIYKHFFGETNSKSFRPSGPFERPDSKDDVREKHRRKQHRSRRSSERKWSRSDQNKDRHMADVKIELGPMPFDPKY